MPLGAHGRMDIYFHALIAYISHACTDVRKLPFQVYIEAITGSKVCSLCT